MKINNVELNEKGSALVIAIFFIMILTVIGLSLMLNTSVDNVVSNNYSKTVRATYTATSGIERFKSYLLYDFKHDPKGWGNRYLVVPQGSTYLDGTVAPSAAEIGGSGSDAYFDLCPSPCSDPNAVPNTSPYKINSNIPYVVQTASLHGLLFPEVPSSSSNPIVTPGAGYQLMLRNVPSTIGGTCGGASDCDATSVYLIAIGTTTTTKAFLNSQSKGMNVIEHGALGSDISVWNNIFFFGDNALTGGGAMTVHGNIHALGPSPYPPYASTTTFDTKADVLNSYYYTNANKSLKSPLRDALSTPQQRNPNNVLDPANNLGAAVRVRNGLVDISQGGAKIGEPSGTGMPFKIVATCHKCGTYGNGFTQANPLVYATKKTDYDVPANLQSLIKVPLLTDPYTDPATNITYPNYTAYFIGLHTATTEYPGVLGLKLATALGNDNVTCFDTSTSPCNSAANQLATVLWSDVNTTTPPYIRRNIFAQNIKDSSAPSIAPEQQPPDPIDPTTEPDPLFSPIIGSGGGSGNAGGKTFMIVATDVAQGVAIVYKEVAPFLRDVAGTSNVSTPRLVHGFVYAPPGANMAALALKVDVDGNDIDHDGHDWIYDSGDSCHSASPVDAACKNTLTVAESNQLVRKVTNALWKAGRGECGYLGPCYESVSKDTWESSMTYGSPTTSRIYDTATNYLKVTATSPEAVNGKLIAFGAIETTDTLYFGNFTYAGRFTMYSRDSNTGGSGVGRINYNDNSYPISSYQWPIASNPATYVAFPCQNNMGVMTPNDIDHSISPHDIFAGAYYAQGTIHLTKQEQILGAMVANAWEFEAGGNPDFFQAMEISHCLPPYIIAKDPIVFVGSQSWTER